MSCYSSWPEYQHFPSWVSELALGRGAGCVGQRGHWDEEISFNYLMEMLPPFDMGGQQYKSATIQPTLYHSLIFYISSKIYKLTKELIGRCCQHHTITHTSQRLKLKRISSIRWANSKKELGCSTNLIFLCDCFTLMSKLWNLVEFPYFVLSWSAGEEH